MKTEKEIVERLNQMEEYQDIETTIGARRKPKLEELFGEVTAIDELIDLLRWVLGEEE